MKRHVFEKVLDPNLHIYVVWAPVLSRMSPEGLAGAARSASRRLADARAQHFLDPDWRLITPYATLLPGLHLPPEEPAWDVYLVFGPEVRWEAKPPLPTEWMHQLDAGPLPLHLDAKKLADRIDALRAAPVR